MRSLISHNIDWKDSKYTSLQNELNLSESLAVVWIKVRMVAKRTRIVSEMIYYPYAVIVLMLLARISFFDSWGFPQALAIVVSANIVMSTVNAFSLKATAESVRAKLVAELKDQLIIAKGTNPPQNIAPASQIEELIKTIQSLNEGAFRPMFQQPVVRAFILLLGGIGFSISQYSSFLG